MRLPLILSLAVPLLTACGGHPALPPTVAATPTGACGPVAHGGRCTTNTDCPEGDVCNGTGCGVCTGACASLPFACPREGERSWCGCDGYSFSAPEQCGTVHFRYRHAGACEVQRCTTDAECPARWSCQGPGCDPGEGVCTPPDRPCTADTVRFCACDGRELVTSSSCPGVRYRNAGRCGAE